MQAQRSANMMSKCSCPLPQFTLHLAVKTTVNVMAIEEVHVHHQQSQHLP